MKIVRTYQQTFVSGVAATKVIFRFNKLYKQDPKNKFQISCSCLAYVDSSVANPKPHLFFASGLQAVNSSNSNVSYIAYVEDDLSTTNATNNQPEFNTNDFFLGVLGSGTVTSPTSIRGESYMVSSPKIIVDDLPLDDITIYYRTPDTSNATKFDNVELDGMFFAFEINEIHNE